MLTILFSLFVLISANLHIRAEYRGPQHHVYIFKPLTTSLIILIALQATASTNVFYKYAIVAGLIFSLAGDIFLMLPSDRFIAGLVSFLAAHLCYIVAFSAETGFYLSVLGLLPFLLYGIAILAVLIPHVNNKLRLPVTIYTIVIVVMAWQALGQWLHLEQTRTLLAFLGAVIFVVSDSALAINRFRKPFKSARLVTLGTYFVAQWLIALSV